MSSSDKGGKGSQDDFQSAAGSVFAGAADAPQGQSILAIRRNVEPLLALAELEAGAVFRNIEQIEVRCFGLKRKDVASALAIADIEIRASYASCFRPRDMTSCPILGGTDNRSCGNAEGFGIAHASDHHNQTGGQNQCTTVAFAHGVLLKSSFEKM